MDADVLIAGAGCAGLSLAVHLLDAAPDLEILLLDPRESHVRDRTWCFWSGARHPFEDAVRHSWNRWRVVTDRGEVERGSESVAYQCIPADAFYERALDRIERAPRARLARGVSVEGFRQSEGSVTAVTSAGELRAARAYDGRPPEARPVPPGEIHWLQHFVGLEIETVERAFDPGVATLMDFRIMDGADIRFMYVLPLDERRALVEDTFFGGETRPEAEYVDSIRRYIRDRLGVESWTERHRERGAIPMSTVPPVESALSRVTPIGVRAGLARPATGYAFLAIQRRSRRIAVHASRVGLDSPPASGRPYPRATAFLDRVFLAYLDREPRAAPEMFRSMFAGVEPERMARFMFDGGSRSDRIALMRSLPAAPLIGQTLRSLGPALRDATRRT
ncbi:MAG: lycopene cyclase family protein [marine benthic group bacterium]|nr:lycopene cyclase family protein [Candidatus Benthicola marisminoris]